MNLIEQLTRIALKQPDKIALKDNKQQLNWQSMMHQVEQLAAQLKLYKHQVVALYADNSVDWVLVDLAAMQAEVVLLPLPGFFSAKQIEHSLYSSNAAAIITDNQQGITAMSKVETLTESLGVYSLSHVNTATVLPEQTQKITFTSGSTGQPKGVCLSIKNQQVVAEALLERTALLNAHHLCVLPLSTLLENIAGVYAPLLSGGSVMLLPAAEMGFNGGKGFNPALFIEAISQQQPNSLIVLPELLQALLMAAEAGWQAPASLKFIAVGGSRVAPNLLARAQKYGLPVYEGYGLSECSSVVCLNSPKHNQPGTVGQVLPHVSVEVIDGEIVVSGNAFLGYLNQPDSWGSEVVYTGDRGLFDSNDNVIINGRIKNVLISSFGRNISPEWIESEILANPMIKHCVVVGDAKPYCSALIEPRHSQLQEADIDDWLDKVNAQLPDYAQIAVWQLFEQPLSVQNGTLTANGRPVRARINQLYQQQIEDLYKEKV